MQSDAVKIMSETVCAVVVTYNRKELLRRCLKAILAQTRPPETILVVNNASTDGTAAMLKQEFPEIRHLEMPENMGGAGGFHYGIAWAVERGFTWISVMDDDGQPAPDCFARLLVSPDPSLQVRGALVLNEADESQLAFTLYPTPNPIDTVIEAEKLAKGDIIHQYISPFNGLFIASSVVEAIGLPEKEFFFWGDEYEYFLRLKRAQVPMGIITTARFYHPRDRMQIYKVRLVFKEFPVYFANNPLKDYLIVRNQAYILKKYLGWAGWLAHVARHLVFNWQQTGKAQSRSVFQAAWHGARADFSHHKKFLT